MQEIVHLMQKYCEKKFLQSRLYGMGEKKWSELEHEYRGF